MISYVPPDPRSSACWRDTRRSATTMSFSGARPMRTTCAPSILRTLVGSRYCPLNVGIGARGPGGRACGGGVPCVGAYPIGACPGGIVPVPPAWVGCWYGGTPAGAGGCWYGCTVPVPSPCPGGGPYGGGACPG